MNVLGRTGLCIGMVCATTVLTGCLVSGSSRVENSGQRVSDRSVTLLEEGKTTEDQVLELVGVPSRVVDLGDTRKIYVYEWSRREASSTSVLVLFSGSSSRETRGALNIEMVDGIVRRWWSEDA